MSARAERAPGRCRRQCRRLCRRPCRWHRSRRCQRHPHRAQHRHRGRRQWSIKYSRPLWRRCRRRCRRSRCRCHCRRHCSPHCSPHCSRPLPPRWTCRLRPSCRLHWLPRHLPRLLRCRRLPRWMGKPLLWRAWCSHPRALSRTRSLLHHRLRPRCLRRVRHACARRRFLPCERPRPTWLACYGKQLGAPRQWRSRRNRSMRPRRGYWSRWRTCSSLWSRRWRPPHPSVPRNTRCSRCR